MQKSQHEKVVKSKMAAQKWQDNGKTSRVMHKAYLLEMKFLNLMVEVPRIFEFLQFSRS